MEHETLCQRVESRYGQRRLHCVRSLSPLVAFLPEKLFAVPDCLSPTNRKVWDTYSGSILHSFPHNHIVRSVALSPTASHLLTAGNEKKVRLFDLTRPDADPSFMKRSNGADSHDAVIKSVIWDGERAVGVSAGDDKVIRCDWAFHLPITLHTRQIAYGPRYFSDGGISGVYKRRPP